jgi:septal ring factor EnvC (AmiA/AmiB activator)
MPKPSRDLTSKERKDRLAANIAADSFIMALKCFHCTQTGVPCQADLRTGRCVECARLGQSCNKQVTRIAYEKIRRSREKVTKELEETEAAEDDLTRKLLELRVRVRRLRKQLNVREEKESQAQDCEAESIAEAVRCEEELLMHPMQSFPLDSATFEPYLVDGLPTMSPQAWESPERVLCSIGESVEGRCFQI